MYIRKETLSMKLLRILKNQLKNSWFLFAFIIVALILWNTYRLFQNLSTEQRTKMELWAMAQEEYIQNQNFSNLTFEVLQRSGINPMIQVDKDGYIIEIRNIPWIQEKQDSTELYKVLSQLKKENDPIIAIQQKMYIYEEESWNQLEDKKFCELIQYISKKILTLYKDWQKQHEFDESRVLKIVQTPQRLIQTKVKAELLKKIKIDIKQVYEIELER